MHIQDGRERSFEIVWKNQWISGVFDRVVFSGDSVWIQDFKTNAARNEDDIVKLAEQYQPQMDRYRQVLASMLEIAESDVICELLFTAPALGGRRVAV